MPKEKTTPYRRITTPKEDIDETPPLKPESVLVLINHRYNEVGYLHIDKVPNCIIEFINQVNDGSFTNVRNHNIRSMYKEKLEEFHDWYEFHSHDENTGLITESHGARFDSLKMIEKCMEFSKDVIIYIIKYDEDEDEDED